ncbi:hypothetical protein LPJ61_002934 [Coemansia biformis]|uniref:Uncharacterized protein n=1 Tax=Coemansia biformis TaxID=1286918 RepID=A0A9W8CZ45_9FUNG|nr:hypothetical protein LPJ61_002934 [Coemansia biformis]
MAHPALENGDLVLRIVRESLWLELGGQDRRRRLEGLVHASRLLTVCRAWRNILGAYLGSHLVLSMHREPKQSRLKMLTSTALPRNLPFGKARGAAAAAAAAARGAPRQTVVASGASLYWRTNIPLVARFGVSRVKTMVLAVYGALDSAQVAACIEASRFCRQPWPGARALHIELHAGPDDGPLQSAVCSLERIARAVLEHAPFVSSLVVTRAKPVAAASSLSLALAFGDQTSQLVRVDVDVDVMCTGVPAVFPALTSLTVALEPGLAPERLAGIAASPLQRLSLLNAEEGDLAAIFCPSAGAAAGAFGQLRMLAVSLRVRTVGSGDGQQAAAGGRARSAPLSFPRLEVVSLSGFRQSVPLALLRAVAAAPVRSLLIDMTIHNAWLLDFRRMALLRHLEVLLPHHDDVQHVLDTVFAGPATLLAISIITQTPLRGQLPETVQPANLRRLRIDTLVPLADVWRALRQLPRLVFLETKTARLPEPEDEPVPLGDAAQAILRSAEPASSSLQVLDIWHLSPLCAPDGSPTRLGAEIVARAARIPTLQRLGCRTPAASVRLLLAALLLDDAVAARAAHLRGVDVRASCLQ